MKCDKLWEGADEGVVMRRLVVGFVLAGLMVLPSLVIVDPAGATVPGENGLLVYVQDVPSQVSGVTAGEIYTMYPDGTVVRRLTSDAGRSNGTAAGSDVVVSENSSPRWSPDSPIIAYVHMNESAEYSVRLMDAEGTFIRTVTDEFSPIASLAWSPDGSQLAIVGTDLEGGGDGIWTMNLSGANPRPRRRAGTAGSAAWSIRDLDWSPDGRSIAFSTRSGSNSRRILLAQVDSGRSRSVQRQQLGVSAPVGSLRLPDDLHCVHCRRLWDHLMATGEPHGMANASVDAFEVRRIEGGILDNLTDIDASMNPWEAGLGGFVDLDKDADFIGRDALRAVSDHRPRLLGIKCPGATPDSGSAVLDGDKVVGRITAGGWSPFQECGVGYVRFADAGDWSGRELSLAGSDGKTAPCTVVALPFYDPDKRIPRGLDRSIP